MLTSQNELISEIETFCQTKGLRASEFGELALNDRSFFSDLKKGREPMRKTEKKIREFMNSFSKEAAQ